MYMIIPPVKISEGTSQSCFTEDVPPSEGLSEGLREDDDASPGPFPLRLSETTTPDDTDAATNATNPRTKPT